jgi:Family of unknown function (DUF6524)
MSEARDSSDSFGFSDFLVRLGCALVMVLATWNPSGHSFVDWVASAWSAGTLGALHAFVAMLLLIGWVILIRATFNSLGLLGLVLGGLLLGVSVWLLFDLGLLSDHSTTMFAWIVLCCVATLLAFGLSWSYVWKRLTGQLDVDDFDRR